jgi:(2Fe-2S) ferredoxin
VRDVLVLVCGHGGRDLRCGITGPILRHEFERLLPEMDIQVLKGPVEVSQGPERMIISGTVPVSINTARVGLISHVGGHKFAGNVIVYIPPGTKTATRDAHPLAGCGIWYGRIEPKHVEGIIKETIIGGRVIEDHFRGGIKQGGEILRL